MKNLLKIAVLTVGAIIAAIAISQAQDRIDVQRMDRDIEVAENVLGTLIKQQFSKRNFFPMEVEGTYTEGYGVTFRLPMDFGGQMMFMMDDGEGSSNGNVTVNGYSYSNSGKNYSYSKSSSMGAPTPPAAIGSDSESSDDCENCPVRVRAKRPKQVVINTKNSNDSLHLAYNRRVVVAAQNFLADYGDLIGQLTPNEKINITNRMEGARNWIWKTEGGRSYLSLEINRSDITLYKQGKLSREEFIAKIRTVNSETTDDVSPDLELLSSIISRLYQWDLSKTYFIQEDLYYERLKDYGVIFNMHVFSSTEADFKKLNMPTLGLESIDQEERDKKVTELYPVFEKNIKTDLLEYGKTLRSLKDQEVLMFKIKVTQCRSCGIPSSLEISVKDSVLKDYSSGKISLDTALGEVIVKKGPEQ